MQTNEYEVRGNFKYSYYYNDKYNNNTNLTPDIVAFW